MKEWAQTRVVVITAGCDKRSMWSYEASSVRAADTPVLLCNVGWILLTPMFTLSTGDLRGVAHRKQQSKKTKRKTTTLPSFFTASKNTLTRLFLFYSASTLLTMQTAVIVISILSVRLSVLTFWCFVQKNEDTIVQFTESGRTIPLVSREVKFIRIFTGDHPQRRR